MAIEINRRLRFAFKVEAKIGNLVVLVNGHVARNLICEQSKLDCEQHHAAEWMILILYRVLTKHSF